MSIKIVRYPTSKGGFRKAFVSDNASDTIRGTNKGDDFFGNGGNDTIIGGRGLDIAYFSGRIKDYTITWVDGALVVSHRNGGRDGTDVLYGVERLSFRGKVYDVADLNQQPVIKSTGSLTYVENGSPAALNPALTLSDPDSPTLARAVVTITTGYRPGEDVLSFDPQNGITGQFDAATGTLTLTGKASVAAYEAALRSVTYRNTSENPTGGDRTISIQADDGQGLNSVSEPVTSTVTVVPVNDAPEISHGAGSSTLEDAAVSFTGTAAISIADVDAGAGPVSVTLSVTSGALTLGSLAGVTVMAGANGSATVTLQGPLAAINAALATMSYKGGANFNGSDALTITTSDLGHSGGPAQTDTATIPITIVAVNDAPVAGDDTGTTAEEGPVSGNLLTNDTDVESATSALMVTQFTLAGDTNVYWAGQTASIAGVGTLVINANGSYTFTPAVDYTGAVPTVTYTVSDGATTDIGTLTLTVSALNDTPVAQDDTGSANEDVPVTGNVRSNDTDFETPTASLTITTFQLAGDATVYTAGQTAMIAGVGTLVISTDGTYTFTPVLNYNGPVPVATYTVSDGSLTDTGTLTVTLNTVNDDFSDASETPSTDEDTPATGNLLTGTTSPDGPVSIKSFTVAGDATSYTAGQTATITGVGTIEIQADGDYTFTPLANYDGTVPVVTYTITDGSGTDDTSTLSLTINPLNDAPVATDDTNSTNEDLATTGNVLTNDGDVETANGSLTVTGFTVAGDLTVYTAGQTATIAGVGTLTIAASGAYTFTPAGDYNGAVPVATYTVSDGDTGTDTGTLTITLNAVNDAPVPVNDTLSNVAEDAATVTFTAADLTGNDAAGPANEGSQTLTVTSVTNVVGGTAVVVNGAVQFTPTLNYNGTASFTYTVQDNGTTNGSPDPKTATASASFTITAVNDAPVAVNDTNSTSEGTDATGNVLTNDSDVETANNVLSVTQFTLADDDTIYLAGETATVAGIGTLAINANGTYTFTPVANYIGDVPLATYTMQDADGSSASATLALEVEPDADFTGTTVRYFHFFPNRETANSTRDFVVDADGVKFPYRAGTGVSAFVEIVGDKIILSTTASSIGFSQPSGADGFHGFQIADFFDQLPDIEGVSVDPASVAFDLSRLSFDNNSVTFNIGNFSLGQNDRVILDVDFV